MLCSDTAFVEAIFTGDALLSQIEEIRILLSHTRRFAELLSATYSDELIEGEQEEAESYVRLMERLEADNLLERMREV
jgi:hypothetical protein